MRSLLTLVLTSLALAAGLQAQETPRLALVGGTLIDGTGGPRGR